VVCTRDKAALENAAPLSIIVQLVHMHTHHRYDHEHHHSYDYGHGMQALVKWMQ
jgi:hypothetical protein